MYLPENLEGGVHSESLAFKINFYVGRTGGGVYTYALNSLIKDLNKVNDINTMYMYSLNSTAYS